VAEEVLFVNVPIPVEPTVEPTIEPTVAPTASATVPPTVAPTVDPGQPTATVPPATEPPVIIPPDVKPPAVTPEVKVPIEVPAVEPTAEADVVTLPNTGTSGAVSPATSWLVGLGGALAVVLLAAGLITRRVSR
jgi:hypothetical protein